MNQHRPCFAEYDSCIKLRLFFPVVEYYILTEHEEEDSRYLHDFVLKIISFL